MPLVPDLARGTKALNAERPPKTIFPSIFGQRREQYYLPVWNEKRNELDKTKEKTASYERLSGPENDPQLCTDS